MSGKILVINKTCCVEKREVKRKKKGNKKGRRERKGKEGEEEIIL